MNAWASLNGFMGGTHLLLCAMLVSCQGCRTRAHSESSPYRGIDWSVTPPNLLRSSIDPRILDLSDPRLQDCKTPRPLLKIFPAVDLSLLGLPDAGICLGQTSASLIRQLEREDIPHRNKSWHYPFEHWSIERPLEDSPLANVTRVEIWATDRIYRIKLYFSDTTMRYEASTNAAPTLQEEKRLLAVLENSFQMKPEVRVPLHPYFRDRMSWPLREDRVRTGSFMLHGVTVEVRCMHGNLWDDTPAESEPIGRDVSITYSYLPLSEPADAFFAKHAEAREKWRMERLRRKMQKNKE